MKWSLLPRFGLPDCLHWGGGNGSSFHCSTHMPMVRAYSCPAFLPPSAGYHYIAVSLGLKMPSKASKLRSRLMLDILLYYLCWFPICHPSWARQLPSGSPVFVWEPWICIWNATADQPMAQVNPAELPPPLLLVCPAAAGVGVGSGLWVARPRAWYFLLLIS